MGDMGYRYAPAEEVGQRALHLGSEQRGLCEQRAKSCTGRRWGSEPRAGVRVGGLQPSGAAMRAGGRAARKGQNRACKGQGPRAKGERRKGPGGGQVGPGVVRHTAAGQADGPTGRSEM
jgi:hypothetical protein